MPARSPLTLKFEQRRFNAALGEFLRQQAPAVATRVVRKVAFDVGAELTKSLNGEEAGYPNPKRIDTGRYRAGWTVAVEQATGTAPGSASGGQAGDGEGKIEGRGVQRTATVQNNVEYGPYIEHGTTNEDGSVRMAPGMHLERALRVATRDVQEVAGVELAKAWTA